MPQGSRFGDSGLSTGRFGPLVLIVGVTLIKPNYLKECYRHVHRGREREGIAAIIKSSMGGWDASGGTPKQETVYL